MGVSFLEHRLNQLQSDIDSLTTLASNLPTGEAEQGSASYFMIQGKAASRVRSDETTLEVNKIEVYGEWGEDPRADPSSTTEAITVANDKLDLEEHDDVHAVYVPGDNATTHWAAFVPGGTRVGTGISKGGDKAKWHNSSTSMTSGCIEIWPFITPQFFDVENDYSESDKVLVPIPAFEEDTAYSAGDKVTLSVEAFNPTQSYATNDQVHYGGKLYKASGAVDPHAPPAFDPSQWTLLDDCYSPTVYEANTAVSADAFDPNEWDEVCADYEMWEVKSGQSVTAPTVFDEDATYNSGDKVSHLGNRYEAPLGVPVNDPPGFDAAQWTALDNFDPTKWNRLPGNKYIDKSANTCTVKISHGMTEDPDEGHYCEWVRGELVWYDCFQLAGWN